VRKFSFPITDAIKINNLKIDIKIHLKMKIN